MKKLKLLTLFALLATFGSNAQGNKSVKESPAQITFLYPVGTNGIRSADYSNKFSFNVLFGINGGLNGFEIGSIANINKGNVKGFQLAGIGNINSGHTEGMQVSAVNVALKNMKGFQLGVVNYSENHEGFKWGVMNVTRKLKGVQLGVFNYIDSIESGVLIGIVNIVKNGYYALEFTAGEVLYANLSFKMGIERFYTILKTGYSYYKSKPICSYGAGFGTHIPLKGEKHSLNIDLTGNRLIYDKQWKKANILCKLDFNYNYKLTDKFSLMVGPSLNLLYSPQKVDGNYGVVRVPYNFKSINNANIFNWVGINAGVCVLL